MDIVSILQASAKEAKEEEREEADEAIAIVKHEIIQEKNLGSSTYSDGLDSPRENASRELYERLNVKDDVDALLKDMNIQPKYVGSDLDDDVDALLRMKKEISLDDDSRRKEEAQLRRRARYLLYFDIILK